MPLRADMIVVNQPNKDIFCKDRYLSMYTHLSGRNAYKWECGTVLSTYIVKKRYPIFKENHKR